MSNPFLVDLNDSSYTPYSGSGTHTPYSGTATPKRRNSTNPFEILSPENEFITFLDSNPAAIKTPNETNSNSNVATAIADMTAEFYQTITAKSYEPNDDVFDDENVDVKFDDGNIVIDDDSKLTGNGAVFDPFQTIHDDDAATVSSKRSSIENQYMKDDSVVNTPVKKTISKAKELFNSSMAEIELLASTVIGNNNQTTQLDQPTDYSPMSPENLLLAPQGMDVGSSDLSDLSDVSSINAAAMADSRSAFTIYSGKEFPDQEQIDIDDDEMIISGKTEDFCSHFDPFTTVLTDSPTVEDSEANMEEKAQKNESFQNTNKKVSFVDHSSRRPLETIHSGSIDLNYIGNPNPKAEGFINDAFDEIEKQKSSVDISEIDVRNIQPDELRNFIDQQSQQIVEDDDTNKPDLTDEFKENLEESVQPRKDSQDPFDTSNFDSNAFEAFESRFESTDLKKTENHSEDPFASPYKSMKPSDNEKNEFDTFEPFVPKQPENTPYKTPTKPKKKKDSFEDSFDSDDDDDSEESEQIKVVIRAKINDAPQSNTNLVLPLLPPPPKSPKRLPQSLLSDQNDEDEQDEEPSTEDMILTSYKSKSKAKKKTVKSFIDEEFDRFFGDTESRTTTDGAPVAGEDETEWPIAFGEAASKRTAGGDVTPPSPQTPLYDEDTSQPLEDYPPPYLGDGWEMMLRHPAKKKLTANRYWKKIFVRFLPETCLLQLFNKKEDPQPFQELPLQASYSLSEVAAQQYDQYGKIFTIKVQYVFYRERVGVRPGQLAKVMQGQIQSMGDLARIGMPVEHAPQISELLKIGSLEYSDVKELMTLVEESMFRLTVHRDRALTYKTEEIQCCVQDECYVEQNKIGIIDKQLARVRIFFLAFLNGMPSIEVGINDLRRQGKEVVGRHDILPVVTEEWIRVERAEFHSCVQSEFFETDKLIRLIPPDACQFELMRFRIRPPKNRELPLQVSAHMNITSTRMDLKCDVLVPGCISRKHGQIPCEDIQIRFHIPECWIYFFRVEKHFRYGAIHSTNRRSGKLKGFDRFLGTAANPEPQLIEVTAGLAKYEHAYHSIVWRIPKLPKDGQGAYTQQMMMVRLPLSSFDRIPETFYDYVHVEFRMPSTTVSHTTLRSISISSCENPPEKFVRYISKYEYKIGLNISYDETKPEPEYALSSTVNNGSVKNTNTEEHSSEDEHNDGDDGGE